MGDAHMRPEDAAFAAQAARTCLAQVLDTATGRSRGYDIPYVPMAPSSPDGMDICKSATLPQRAEAGKGRYKAALQETLSNTPVPGLGPGLGSQPRARSEVGAFIGLAGSIDGRGVSGGFEAAQTQNGFVFGLDLGVRAGFGLEGALGDAGDGLVFAQLGLAADSPSTNNFSDTGVGAALKGSLGAAIPSRTGLSGRIRMPFYLIPGDLLLLAPMYFYDPERYAQMAVTAANGGVLGWQAGWATRFGRFQFVLGRELGVVAYGLTGVDELIVPSDRPDGLGRVVNFKSIYFELPIVEYRPYRAFASNQSSSLVFQFFVGADIPYDDKVERPIGGAPASLVTVYSLGLRMIFDWRYYW